MAPRPEEEDNFMPEIAYTPFGRNVLVAGLISHVAALLVSMMSTSGAGLFFTIVFPFSCLALMLAAYVELKSRGSYPLKNWRFYVITAATVFPVIGPFIVLGLLYSMQESRQAAGISLSGLFPAMSRLKAHALVPFVVIIILFLLFAVIHSWHDPYFKRRPPNSLLPQSVLTVAQYENIPAYAGYIPAKRETACAL